MSVSVLICCHNAAYRLEPTLEHISRCKADFPVEVIVIDNNSNDDTDLAAKRIWERLGSPLEFRIIRESRPGKTHAQLTGVSEAKNEVIVFCDDDNWLSPDYLMVATEILANPVVGATSGQTEPVFEGPVPTFVYSHGNWLALGVQSLSSEDVTDTRGYVWGAGLAARRRDLQTIYACPGFPILSGPAGVLSTARGDDNEMCWALTVLGKRIIYDERLKLQHFMPNERLQIEYLRKRASKVDFAWDEYVCRITASLRALESGRSRVWHAVRSALRWVRHANWPEERRYQATMFFMACGWESQLGFMERRLYTSFQWLRYEAGKSTDHLAAGREHATMQYAGSEGG
jgi:cellulose synthase/poly-beta-1,6-N-acetylglucosamine synthase-like glycosyltransferase